MLKVTLKVQSVSVWRVSVWRVCVAEDLTEPCAEANHLSWRDSHGALNQWDCAYSSTASSSDKDLQRDVMLVYLFVQRLDTTSEGSRTLEGF